MKKQDQVPTRLLDLQRRVTELEAEVSRLKRAEEASEASYELFRNVLQHAQDGIVLVDEQGVILEWNQGYERITGISRDEAVGQALWDVQMRVAREHLRTPERQALVKTAIQEFLKTGKAPWIRKLQENTIQRADGELRTVQDHIFPIKTDKGFMACAICRDITETKKVEEFRQQYLHTISHDLRAPLTIILGQAQILHWVLEQGGDPDRERSSAQAVQSAAQTMNTMIQDLLDSASLESGHFRLKRQPVDLGLFLPDLLNRMGMVIDSQRVETYVSIDLPPASGDLDRLERILLNLISNALKYSAPGTEVTIFAEPANGGVMVSVVDRGPGISPEELPRIFTRFYRGGANRKAEGLGLGLYITKMLVEAHGGRIWAESDPGQSSAFRFTLPSAQEE